jgi:hypothetical protein
MACGVKKLCDRVKKSIPEGVLFFSQTQNFFIFLSKTPQNRRIKITKKFAKVIQKNA